MLIPNQRALFDIPDNVAYLNCAYQSPLMNAVHFRELGSGQEGRRGKQRDALTLFDESGVIVVSSARKYLDALAGRDWMSVLWKSADFYSDPKCYPKCLAPNIHGSRKLDPAHIKASCPLS